MPSVSNLDITLSIPRSEKYKLANNWNFVYPKLKVAVHSNKI